LPDKGSTKNEKPDTNNWEKQTNEQNARSIANITLDDDENSSKKKPKAMTLDNMETVVAQTQERFSRALKRRYQYESNLKPAQEFLLHHVNSKIPLVIMYADLVGSTKMSMTLPVEKMVTVIRGFSYEMSYLVHSHEGFVLKYVGDAVIAFFPSIHDKSLACDRAVQCAKSMVTVIQKGISPILEQYNHSELKVKVGIDQGKSVIIQYGHDTTSHIDLLGYCINRSAKLTSLTCPNTVTIGEDVYRVLSPQVRMRFKEVTFSIEKWKYIDTQTGQIYKLYADVI
jgi:class 3 adenylate cyclase